MSGETMNQPESIQISLEKALKLIPDRPIILVLRSNGSSPVIGEPKQSVRDISLMILRTAEKINVDTSGYARSIGFAVWVQIDRERFYFETVSSLEIDRILHE